MSIGDYIKIYDEAKSCVETDKIKAIQIFTKFINESPNDDGQLLKLKETSISDASDLLKDLQYSFALDGEGLVKFIKSLESTWIAFPRAKTAKIIKGLLRLFDEINGELGLEMAVELSLELIEWSERDKRAFLKQSLQLGLISLYYRLGRYSEALRVIEELSKYLKKLDDKMTLIEVHLLESKVFFGLKNLAKSRAALTTARTNSAALYTPPLLQAALDMQSGLLFAEEADYKTAYSYFIEALDNFFSFQRDPNGILAIKYMLMCKIMMGENEQVEIILNGKFGGLYEKGKDVEAMQAVADACQKRSLKEFEAALKSFPKELGQDPIIQSHFGNLYDNLLEKNLLAIVTPYSRVQISFISSQIDLSKHDVELKLSQMILDKVLSAIIDQNNDCLILIEEQKVDNIFNLTLECFKQMDGVVDSLFIKANKLVE